MVKVTLQFSDSTLLWLFRYTITKNSVRLDENKMTLICYCTVADIDIAISKYNAKVVEDATLL